MKIIVCVKIIAGEVNPFDETAIELALRLGSDVTVLCMGPKSAAQALLPLTRLGAKAVLLSDPVYAGSDTLATSYILSCALQKMEWDLILCGRQSTDGDTAQTAPALGATLGIDTLTNVLQFSVEGKTVRAHTRFGEETATLPALLTVERGEYLRFPSIFSKVGEVTVWSNQDLGCDGKRCGLAGSPTRVLAIQESQRGRRQCKKITMAELKPLLEEIAQGKIQKAEEPDATPSKVTAEITKKLPKCAVIPGTNQDGLAELVAWGEKLSEEVVVIDALEVDQICAELRKFGAGGVLWGADLWGRRVAPMVAAKLGIGLCADCTDFGSDGDRLWMIRPAKGGSVEAKIQSLSDLQMATARLVSRSGRVMIGVGKGACQEKQLEWVRSFAQEIGAEIGASRGAVDAGVFPYEAQVGLTGKRVSPQVYLAVGISGAVHHVCAIEGSEVIIAINSDPNARIFEFADYGIVTEV